MFTDRKVIMLPEALSSSSFSLRTKTLSFSFLIPVLLPALAGKTFHTLDSSQAKWDHSGKDTGKHCFQEVRW